MRFAYSTSAARTWSNITSRSLPPPRGPLRSEAGALATTLSRYVQQASTRSHIRLVPAAVMGSVSALAEMPGAPKSVVALPVSPSTPLKLVDPVGKGTLANFATAAYRGAYAASDSSAARSFFPARHQPGQPAALAHVRLAPTSRKPGAGPPAFEGTPTIFVY